MKKLLLYLFVLLFPCGCGDLLERQNVQSAVDATQAIRNAATAEVALLGAYSVLQEGNYYGNQYLCFGELPSDNLGMTGVFANLFEIDNHAVFPNNVMMSNTWMAIYGGINRVNNLLAKVPDLKDPKLETKTNGVTLRERLMGEAYLLRAFHYFNLVRLWGGVPLVLRPTLVMDASALVARNSEQECFAQIIKDMEMAESLLPLSYASAAELRGRACKATAQALLSRIYLYTKEWEKAAAKAALVLDNGNYELQAQYASIFSSKNTREAIWELQFSNTDQNNLAFFFLAAPQGRREFAPTQDMMAAYQPGDLRRAASIQGSPPANVYVTKYTRNSTGDDQVQLIRLAEVILNRAEALAELGYPSAEALALLNRIRQRAGLAAFTEKELPDLAAFRLALERERRLELAFEGHRWFDLKRSGRALQVLGLKDANRLLWPIPQREMDVNPKLVQNPGY